MKKAAFKALPRQCRHPLLPSSSLAASRLASHLLVSPDCTRWNSSKSSAPAPASAQASKADAPPKNSEGKPKPRPKASRAARLKAKQKKVERKPAGGVAYQTEVLDAIRALSDRILEPRNQNTFDPRAEFAPEPWQEPNNGSLGGRQAPSRAEVYKKIDSLFERHPPHLTTPTKDTLRSGSLKPSSESILTDLVQKETTEVETLEHGLDRVLFNPGVHWLQDPRSRVYNFTPWLQKIPKVNDFAFEKLQGFVKSSRDGELHQLAVSEKKKYTGSTSSLTGMLSQIYFLLSRFKDPDTTVLTQDFKKRSTSFTTGQRMPASVSLNLKDGVYSVDKTERFGDDSEKNVLTWMGMLLENFLTKKPAEFSEFLRFNSSSESSTQAKSAYRYSKSDKFVMRSQLDCQDSRLPGTGVFDLKTRACLPIRMDVLNFEENAGYMINSLFGWEMSFEREYYDLIRSAFLKYGFQARIGNMDGVMVAYHNTEQIFGFQYISLDEMDMRLFGPQKGLGAHVFNKCVKLLEEALEEATALFPGQSVNCWFETKPIGPVLELYVRPRDWDGSVDEWPIKKLLIRCQHKTDGIETAALVGMQEPESWEVEYQIAEADLSESLVKEDFKTMEASMKRMAHLPSHITTMDEAEVYWKNLVFSKTMEQKDSFDPSTFTLDHDRVATYRMLARKGRDMLKEMEAADAGKPKIVWGSGVYEEGK